LGPPYSWLQVGLCSWPVCICSQQKIKFESCVNSNTNLRWPIWLHLTSS
jgi:hypothetical protein